MILQPKYRKALAEWIGTFSLVFAGCGSMMIAERFAGSILPSVVPLIFGLAVAAMIYAVGHISGAHFNPAVTMGFAVARHFPKKQVLIYWAAQLIGAIMAIGLLRVILPPGQTYGDTTAHVVFWQALIWESIMTFFLMFVIIAVATDTRAEGTMAGAAIGATVMFCAYLGGPVTGASLNPARSLAPAIFSGRFDQLWIYFVGPFLGAVLAALFYEWIRCEEDEGVQSSESNRKDAKGCC